MNHQTVLHSSYTVFCVFQQRARGHFLSTLAATCLPFLLLSEYSHPSEREVLVAGILHPCLSCDAFLSVQADLVLLCIVLLCSADTGLFCCCCCFLFTTQMFVLTLHQGSLLAPFFQQRLIIHDASSCFGNSSSISDFFLSLYLLWLSEVSNLLCYFCNLWSF